VSEPLPLPLVVDRSSDFWGTKDVVVNRRHELSLVNPLHEGVSSTR
jgi:hypothetical protein